MLMTMRYIKKNHTAHTKRYAQITWRY